MGDMRTDDHIAEIEKLKARIASLEKLERHLNVKRTGIAHTKRQINQIKAEGIREMVEKLTPTDLHWGAEIDSDDIREYADKLEEK